MCGSAIVTDWVLPMPIVRVASSKPAASTKASSGRKKRHYDDDDDFEAAFKKFVDELDADEKELQRSSFSSKSAFSPAHDGQKKQGRHFHGIRQRVGGKWAAEIRDPYKGFRVWLGSFNSANDAARAYDAEARRLHGSKAKVNFPAARARRGNPRTAAKAAETPASPKKLRYDDDSPEGSGGGGGGGGSMLDEPAFCPVVPAQMDYYSVGYGYNSAAEAVEDVDDMRGVSLWNFDEFPVDGAVLGRFP